ncbi:MAG: hypothetical protein QGG76_04940, partial [Candidatus Thalassarchaeaceae archaeon]|nr:hypothetical protein [Candidatus Thalassarchaeaceae archaeon]
SINSQTPGTRVEDLKGCGMRAGVHTSLAQLGYTHDPTGRALDMTRIEEALLGTCEQHLGRAPLDPIEWSPEMPA